METKHINLHVIFPQDLADCEHCLERLKTSLRKIDGISDVELQSDSSILAITFSRNVLTLEKIIEEARAIGVQITNQYSHESFQVQNIDCPDCALKIEKGITRLPGVLFASLNFATSKLLVEYDSSKLAKPQIVKKLRDMGYDVARDRDFPRKSVDLRLILTIIAGLLLFSGFLASRAGTQFIGDKLYLAAMLTAVFPVARSGILGLRALSIDTNLLMTAAAFGAIFIGKYSDAAMVIFLFSLGSVLETYAVGRMRGSIKQLMDYFPTQAVVRRNGGEETIPIDEISIGDIVIVRPGDKIATDGVVISGSSWVNESAVTGESTPAEKKPESPVYAGSVNGTGYLEFAATKTIKDNTLSKIIHLIEEAQAEKAPSQRFSERFGKIYSPLVIFSAIGIVTIPTLLFGEAFIPWLNRGLTLLVVACPCALVISTPVVIVSAIAVAARHGLLIKGGAYLESLGSLRVVAFDKTGTLTQGRLEVIDIFPLVNMPRSELLAIAAAAEQQSEHPLAEAVIRRSEALGIEPKPAERFEAIPGKGVCAVVDGSLTYVGSERLLEDLEIQAELDSHMLDACVGKTVSYIIRNARVIGIITLQDAPKQSAVEVTKELKSLGINKIVMLTGDSKESAEAVANQIGVDEVYARLLPDEKVETIRSLIANHKRVAMVGDGINDAPAMAAATVGIAMGGIGSQTALETADIVLMKDDLSKLPFGIALSQKATGVIKINVAFSVAVVLILVAGAITGNLGLTGGVLGHEGSALIVIFNGMRLLRFSYRPKINGGR